MDIIFYFDLMKFHADKMLVFNIHHMV